MSESKNARLDLKTSISLLQLERGEHEAYRSERTVGAIEDLIEEKLAEHAGRIREIAREEIEAAKGYKPQPGDRDFDLPSTPPAPAFPPAAEAPAAGACPHCAGTGRLWGKYAGPGWPKCPRCYGSGKVEDVGPRNAVEAGAGGRGSSGALLAASFRDGYEAGKTDTTALARRLAEALETAQGWMIAPTGRPIPKTDERQVYAALTEARKRGLI